MCVSILRVKYYFLLSLICLTKSEVQNLIVEGEIGQIRQFPYSGFLRVNCQKKMDVAFICGSSIVNQRILLTAAHCVASCSKRNTLFVSTGHGHNAKGVVSSVNGFLIHGKFVRKQLANDIALLTLKTSLKFSFEVQRVALMGSPPYYEKAHVAGWGLVKEIDPEQGTELLHFIDQYVWKKNKCRRVINIGKGTFCASSKSKKSYASSGDSGSALVVRGYIQIGIVSYKMPSISRSLVVYTDTGYFYDWIKKNSKKLYCVIEQA